MTKVTTTIELTEQDREHIRVIQASTGDTTLIAVIRLALRKTAQGVVYKEIAPKIDRVMGRGETP